MNNGKICVSVCAETVDEFIEKIERAAKVADVVELRFDCLDKSEFDCLNLEQSQMVLSKIFRKEYGKPLLSTFRPREQGGNRQLTQEERENFWNSGYDGSNCWADAEVDMIESSWYWLWNTRICSYHDFTATPNDLNQIYSILKATEVDVVKIAVQANDAADGLAVIKLLECARSENIEMIPIAMGEHGIWTRILGLSRGAYMTFASLDESGATAPGQLTVDEMIEVYRVKELDENTEIYGLVAGSTAHSVSPEMHNAAFRFHKLNAVFVPFAVKDLAEFMRRMANPKTREIEWNLRGFSVSNPHKTEIMQYLDEVDETARKIGAVNTVKIENGKLYGFNTDAKGFLEPLKNSYGKLENVKVAVIGAGGAARAVVYALKQEHAAVTIFARNAGKGAALATEFEANFSTLDDETSFNAFQILVNATPLGTKGELENAAPAQTIQIGGVNLLYDLVYNPLQTKLMREAGAVFVPTISGLAMLVAQGAEQQRIWTGKDAPIKEMSAAAMRKLKV